MQLQKSREGWHMGGAGRNTIKINASRLMEKKILIFL
jgi:hypothetical protein